MASSKYPLLVVFVLVVVACQMGLSQAKPEAAEEKVASPFSSLDQIAPYECDQPRPGTSTGVFERQAGMKDIRVDTVNQVARFTYSRRGGFNPSSCVYQGYLVKFSNENSHEATYQMAVSMAMRTGGGMYSDFSYVGTVAFHFSGDTLTEVVLVERDWNKHTFGNCRQVQADE